MTYAELIEEAIQDEIYLIERIPCNATWPDETDEVERQKALVRLTLLQQERKKFL